MRGRELQDAHAETAGRLCLPLRRVSPADGVRVRHVGHLSQVQASRV